MRTKTEDIEGKDFRETKGYKQFLERQYTKAGKFALATLAVFFIIWIIVVWLLARCG